MASSELAIGVIFLSQTIVGFLGNFFLLYHYSFFYITGFTLRSTDLIIKHLAVANSLVILFKGIPHALTTFVLKQYLSNIECKFFFYIHRVNRGVSMGSTCLLSIFQAVIMSPRNSRWAELKLQVPKYIRPFIILCWILNMLVNIPVHKYMTGKWNSKNGTTKIDYGYCSWTVSNRAARPLPTLLFSFYDVLCLGLMIWTSGSMAVILYRHKQQVQHIHGTNLSPRPSPESRATQSILILVSTFASFYTLSTIFSLCMSFYNPSLWVGNISSLITACFPTVSPFVLMSRDLRISRLGSACYWRKT
ncbi:vomeronasal type-1 receptor 3-like [Tupaia chinensis]|uniref:vomeronasal type-1 receptor 3-like n=1 Tax=Tupaia chinensis TaxID=246437 RepID=UPI0003C8C648|nr:vomeronasal type-1 receptor 3-like [Tupaia chinensis]